MINKISDFGNFNSKTFHALILSVLMTTQVQAN